MSQVIKKQDTVIVIPDKDIIASAADDFYKELSELKKESPKEIIIDLVDVKSIDSVGIGVLIAMHNAANKYGGKLKTINVNQDIYNLFCTMRLNQHFSVEKTIFKPQETSSTSS